MRLAPRSFVAAVPGGLLCAGPSCSFEANADQGVVGEVVALLDGDFSPAELTASAGSALADALGEAHAVTASPAVADVPSLLDGLREAIEGGPLPPRMATGDELLAVPSGVDGREARRLLRAFIGGLASHERLRAYAEAARSGWRSVAGDRPAPERLGVALDLLDGLDPAAIHVIDLATEGVESAEAGELEAIGASRVHRLGTVPAARFASAPPPGAPSVHICMARQAPPNLRFPGTRHGYATGIATDARQAELIARAEAAERFACGDLTDRTLVRASRDELDAPAVAPDELIRFSARQLAARAGRGQEDGRRLWTAGTTAAGERRWLPAEMVFTPFADPESTAARDGASSSGCAAYSNLEEARRRALAELVERDAFMWHWVQRVSRELLDPASLPAGVREELSRLRAAGHRVDLVNLTLETKPVILCAIRTADVLSLSASCREDPVDAAGRALREAATLLWSSPDAVPLVTDHAQVRTPLDHLGVYRDPAARDHASFLWSSSATIAADEIASSPEPIEEALQAVGEPVTVDLGSPGSRPFAVARAFVPGLIPLTFGFDREPLGMPRLAEHKLLADGRRVDATVQPGRLGPAVPHPFP